MAARDRVKTMVSRAHTTLDGHPEVKHEKSYTGRSHFWLTQSHKSHPSRLTRLSIVKFLLYNTWSLEYLLENTMAAIHGLLEDLFLILRQVNASTIYCIIVQSCPLVGRGFHCTSYLAHILY